MIRRTRLKFMLILIGSLLILLGILLLNLNRTMDQSKARNINESLDALVANYDKAIPAKVANSNKYFILKLNANNKIVDMVFGQEPLSKEEVAKYKNKVLELQGKRGEVEEFRYLLHRVEGGRIIAFVNTEAENLMLKDLREKSVKIAIVGSIIILLLSYGLSKLIVKPLETAMDKQKKFVSDASHELKTPLSIIKINSELLRHKANQVEPLDEIDGQIDRMSNLINDLLLLAKLENYNQQIGFESFDLSKTFSHCLLQLEVIAFEYHKEIKYHIEEGIIYKGIEKDMITMMEALIDNALKYSPKDSVVSVEFSLKGKTPLLKISNKADPMTDEECSNIFDSFYRMDESRNSQSNGFGIGLCVVNNIATKHGGTAGASYSGGLFTIEIALAKI